MAHNITERDGLVLHGKPAWHGLGVVVKDAPTPAEALQIARLGWHVERAPVKCERVVLGVDADGNPTSERRETVIPSHVANVRQDTGEILGVVGADYSILQNCDLAGLVQRAGQGARVTIESAGSLRAGRDVFFLAHLGSFTIGKADRSHLYALLANSHDGSRALTVLPTSVRVVCANTLRAALSSGESSRQTINLRHTKNLDDRLPDVVAALKGASALAHREEEKARALAARSLTIAELGEYFARTYVAMYGPVPKVTAASTKGEKTRATRAAETVEAWGRRALAESNVLDVGPSAWLAMNAVTGWADHDRPIRGDTDRNYTNLFGSAAAAKATAVETALALV